MSLTWTLVTILCLLGLLAIADTDGRRWHRAWKHRRAQRRQVTITGYLNQDFARWETEYAASRPLPDADMDRWDG